MTTPLLTNPTGKAIGPTGMIAKMLSLGYKITITADSAGRCRFLVTDPGNTTLAGDELVVEDTTSGDVDGAIAAVYKVIAWHDRMMRGVS